MNVYGWIKKHKINFFSFAILVMLGLSVPAMAIVLMNPNKFAFQATLQLTSINDATNFRWHFYGAMFWSCWYPLPYNLTITEQHLPIESYWHTIEVKYGRQVELDSYEKICSTTINVLFKARNNS